MHIYKRKIFGYECDLYGHLNNAKYLNICEEARSDALEQTDYSVNYLYQLGIYMFVRNANIQFIKSIPVGSEISIRSKVVKYTRLRSIW
ncbi:MAG: acyl-CoA thioesterase, partial [Candidatus Cloacimonadota bacterium]|nr:acyl-CoA thioesterase [Candidatus Cloacimonadota bacterium]